MPPASLVHRLLDLWKKTRVIGARELLELLMEQKAKDASNPPAHPDIY